MSGTNENNNLTVPVLVKGDYQNKKTLCDFLEQEKIAKQMLKEAHDFYNRFLISKTVTLREIIEDYPGVKFVRPIVKAYWYDIKIDKNYNVVPLTGNKNKVVLEISFEFDLGITKHSTFAAEITSMFNEYHYWDNLEDARKYNYYFKDPEIVEELYKHYCDFMHSKDCDENTNAMNCKKVIIMTVAELRAAIGKDDTQKTEWYIDEYDEDDENDFYRKPFIGIDEDYLSEKSRKKYDNWEDDYFYRAKHLDKAKQCTKMFLNIPEVRNFVEEHVQTLDTMARDVLKSLLNNYKCGETYMRKLYLITRDSIPIELVCPDLDESDVDMETGKYTVNTVTMTESHPEYQWPSDCDLIVTKYSQTFVFDIMTNDLVDYRYNSYTRRESRKSRKRY